MEIKFIFSRMKYKCLIVNITEIYIKEDVRTVHAAFTQRHRPFVIKNVHYVFHEQFGIASKIHTKTPSRFRLASSSTAPRVCCAGRPQPFNLLLN